MTWKDRLKRIITEDAILSVSDGEERTLVLCEENVMKVHVTDAHQADLVAIRMRSGSGRLNLLKPEQKGRWNLVCDYILFGYVGGVGHVVLIEMKKTFGHDSHGKEQLRRSLPVVDYLRQICELEFEESITSPRVSYVLLYDQVSPRLDKGLMKSATGLLNREKWKSIIIKEYKQPRLRFRDLVED